MAANTRSGNINEQSVARRRSFATREALLAACRRQFLPTPVYDINTYVLGNERIVQAVLRMPFNCSQARQYLRRHILELLAQNVDDAHLEVSVTFNSVLYDVLADSWVMFYGLDYQSGRGRTAGVHQRLTFDAPTIVNNIEDIRKIPIVFNVDELYERYQVGFEHSHVHLDSIINTVYLIQMVFDSNDDDDNNDDDGGQVSVDTSDKGGHSSHQISTRTSGSRVSKTGAAKRQRV